MAAMIPFTSTRASLTAPASRPAVCRRFLPEATGMDLGACAVAAGVLGAAAARPRRLRDFARPPLLLREPVALVDCGSGSTRALFFQDDGHSHVRASKSRWRGDPLAVALRDDLKLDGLLRLLKQELPSGPVMLGATAGVRQALQDGALCGTRLQLFEDRLREVLGGRAKFMVLGGQEEARAEWEALQHALDYRLDLEASQFDGMLSGGGMSCQLALRGRDVELFSFPNGVLEPGKLADRASREAVKGSELLQALAEARSTTEALVRQLPEGMRGSFALVEWLGLYVAGESTERDLVMGLGYDRWLSREEILRAVAEHLNKLQKEYLRHSRPITRRAAISWVYGIILQTLLQHSFDAETSFYCFKGITWSTGHYLMHRETVDHIILG